MNLYLSPAHTSWVKRFIPLPPHSRKPDPVHSKAMSGAKSLSEFIIYGGIIGPKPNQSTTALLPPLPSAMLCKNQCINLLPIQKESAKKKLQREKANPFPLQGEGEHSQTVLPFGKCVGGREEGENGDSWECGRTARRRY